MSMLMETTGDFALVCPATRQELRYDRPTVVRSSAFFEDRVAARQVKIIHAELPDSVTDDAWATIYDKAEKNTAVALKALLASIEKAEKAKEKQPAEAVV